jgi:hypothetical protein
MRRIVTAFYGAIGVLIALVTVAAAAELKILADVYAWFSPALKPLAALPWVRQVAAQSHKFPLAEAHVVLVLAGLILIFGTAWAGALRALRESVTFVGTDIASLRDALRESFFMRTFVPPAGWRSSHELTATDLSPGDQLFVQKRTVGVDDLVIRYYTHKRILPGFLVIVLIAGTFFLLPELVDGSKRSDPAWFFFGRLLVAIAAVYSSFALLLFLAAHLSRASSEYGRKSDT